MELMRMGWSIFNGADPDYYMLVTIANAIRSLRSYRCFSFVELIYKCRNLLQNCACHEIILLLLFSILIFKNEDKKSIKDWVFKVRFTRPFQIFLFCVIHFSRLG